MNPATTEESKAMWSPPKQIAFRHRPAPYPDYTMSVPLPYLQGSFESSGSGTSYPSPPYPTGPYPPPMFPFYPPTVYYPPPQPTRPTEYVIDIKPGDVLCGRGGATNSHSGNRAFRNVVKEYQKMYLNAKKKDKPAVASRVVKEIRKKGGRFLRRCSKTSSGEVVWADIGDEAAREKTCQALREGAPLIRKRKDCGDDDVQALGSESHDNESVANSSYAGEESKSASRVNIEYDSDFEGFQHDTVINGQITICPMPELLQGRHCPVSVSLDSLKPDDREMYLRDFLPPSNFDERPTDKA